MSGCGVPYPGCCTHDDYQAGKERFVANVAVEDGADDALGVKQ